MVAALTPLPVIGVPVRASTLDGLDSLLSIVQVYHFQLLYYYIYGMCKFCKDQVSYEYNFSPRKTSAFKLNVWNPGV